MVALKMHLPTIQYAGFISVLAMYLGTTFLYFLRYILRKSSYSIHALRLLLAGFVLHSLLFGHHLLKQPYPYLLGSFETFQLVSLGIMAALIILSIFSRFVAMGVLLVPIGLIFFGLSLNTSYEPMASILGNNWAFVHVATIFMSVPIFVVSLIVGALYILKEAQIKRKHFSFSYIPPLEVLDVVHYRSLYLGFVLFTVGIITGAGWSKSTIGYYVSNDLKQMVSLMAWIMMALFLNLRVSQGWIGRRGILLSSVGLFAVLFLLSVVH